MKNKTNIIQKINSFKNEIIEGKKEPIKSKKSLKNIDTKLSPESLQRNNLISNDNKKSPVLCVSARRIKINQHMKITAKNKDLNPSSTKKFSMQKNNSNDTLSLSYQIFNKTKQRYEKQTSLGKKDIKTNKAKRNKSSSDLIIRRNKSIDKMAQIFITNNSETKKNKIMKKNNKTIKVINSINNNNANNNNKNIQSNQIDSVKNNLKFCSNIVNYNNFQNFVNNNLGKNGNALNSLTIGSFNKTYNNNTNSYLSSRKTKNTSVKSKTKIAHNDPFNSLIYNYNQYKNNKSSSKDKLDIKRKRLNDDIQNILIMNKENKYQTKPKLNKNRKHENEKTDINKIRNNRLTEANKKKSESNILSYNNNKNNINNTINKKKNIFYQYIILKGNASYLVKNCMQHRINWLENNSTEAEKSLDYNFKWKELSFGNEYIYLSKNPKMKQMVNHFEFHQVISNKANLFINLMKYCEKNNLSVFKYVPFTIVFKIKDRRKIKNKAKQKRWNDKLEKLKNFIQRIDTKVKNYKDIGNYYNSNEYIHDKKSRDEFELMKQRKKLIKKEDDNNKKHDEEKYKGKFEVYSDTFPRLKKVDNSLKSKEQNDLKDLDLEKKVHNIIGSNTLIEIPKTHFKGRNMWVLKAVNLNRGMCIRVVNSFQQMAKVINKFKSGVDLCNFTLEKIDEKENEENLNSNLDKINEEEKNQEQINDNKINKEKNLNEKKDEILYNCNKILIQKYIESPLLYRGRKCDMRIWVLLTHEMKVYFFKEGHLKTCSVEYDVNSEDAFTHITNYSFQKYNSNFQKFEKGNEVPFYEFQKFIDEAYPEKHYKVKKNLTKQIKEIIKVTMLCSRNKINKNKRSFQFEIFGYDFMMDSDFNLFLIEINFNPGLEISSPWIQIVVPRMLDDALRLTLDKVFEPVYDFNKNYVGEYTAQQKKLLNNSEIKIDFNAVDANIANNANNSNTNNKNTNTYMTKDSTSQISSNITKGSNHLYSDKILNINIELDDFDKQLLKDSTIENEKNIDNISKTKNEENNQRNEIYIEENKSENIDKKSNSSNKTNKKNKKKKKKYISPFPVPGYSLDENLWEFVCDLNIKNEEENKINKINIKEKELNKDKINFTGIKHLLNRKKSKPKTNLEKNKEF